MINWFKNLFKEKPVVKPAPVITVASTFDVLDRQLKAQDAGRKIPTKSQAKRIAAQQK